MPNPLISIVIPTFGRPDLLLDCLSTVFASSYQNLQIIVVDNNPDGSASKLLQEKFPQTVETITNYKNLGASGARAQGAKQSRGNWVLFIDDDNLIDPEMISHLVSFVEQKEGVGGIAPLMHFDNKKVWFSGANFNFLSSQADFFPLDEAKLPKEPYECDLIHNVYMLRRTAGEKVGWFDEKMFMGYEEADLLIKVKRLGYKVFMHPQALTEHVHPPTNDLRIRLISTPAKAYSTIRNRMVIMKRYAPFLNLIIFSLFFYPAFFAAYLLFILMAKRWDLVLPHVRGFGAGYFFMLTNKII